MPSISTIRSGIAELPKGSPLVVALTGGTTGIGSYVATSLATTFAQHGSKLRVYIVGRNAARAETVISEGKKLSPGSEWIFVKATDLALISDVDKACAEIMRREKEAPFKGGEPRVDVLYMSHCYPILKERSTTTEGLDAFISTTYYSRIRFITRLLPLLLASPNTAHVISIYAGGMEDGVSPTSPLPIGTPPPSVYGITGVRKHTCFMKNFLFETLAQKYAGKISLAHIYPGLVDGPTFMSPDMPLWFRVVWTLVRPLARLVYMTPPDVCGDVMVFLATGRYPAQVKGAQAGGEGVGEVVRSTTGEIGGGSYALGQRGDAWSKGVSYEKVRKENTRQLVWDHTMEVLEGIEKRNQISE